MTRYLIVANQTLGGEHLLEKVRELAEVDPASFHILVPATPPQGHLTYTVGRAEAVANERLEAALARLAQAGFEATGEVGTPEPLDAIRDLLRRRAVDAIVLSTLPPGPSRWLRQDLLHRVERAFDVPVHHVVAPAEVRL
jgi:hypothetical protein